MSGTQSVGNKRQKKSHGQNSGPFLRKIVDGKRIESKYCDKEE